MAKAVKLSDIAKKLGVSAVTVSKALSGQKGVSDEKRDKIIRLADEMGYVRKVSKTETPSGQSYTFGVIVTERYINDNQSFYWMMYQELSKYAISQNCFTILEVIISEVEARLELPRVFTERKVDGLIFMGECRAEYLRKLMANVKVPFLNLDTVNPVTFCDSIVSNNMLGGYQMTNYLFEQGHKKIGFVGTRLVTSSIDDRFFGYVKSLMEHNIALREDWVLQDRDRRGGRITTQNAALFRLPKEMPTAFFCNCDLAASLLIAKLEREGYSVPGEISIVGFDNFINDQIPKGNITTYEIDVKQMVTHTVMLLLHKIENPDYTTGIFMLPGRLIERNSVRRIAAPVPCI